MRIITALCASGMLVLSCTDQFISDGSIETVTYSYNNGSVSPQYYSKHSNTFYANGVMHHFESKTSDTDQVDHNLNSGNEFFHSLQRFISNNDIGSLDTSYYNALATGAGTRTITIQLKDISKTISICGQFEDSLPTALWELEQMLCAKIYDIDSSDQPVSFLHQSGNTTLQFPYSKGTIWNLTDCGSVMVTGDTVWDDLNSYAILNVSQNDFEYPMYLRIDSLGKIHLIQSILGICTLDPSKIDQTYGDSWYKVTVSKIDSLETPNGVIRNCIDFYIDVHSYADEESGFTFAPDIGLVRIYRSMGGITIPGSCTDAQL